MQNPRRDLSPYAAAVWSFVALLMAFAPAVILLIPPLRPWWKLVASHWTAWGAFCLAAGVILGSVALRTSLRTGRGLLLSCAALAVNAFVLVRFLISIWRAA